MQHNVGCYRSVTWSVATFLLIIGTLTRAEAAPQFAPTRANLVSKRAGLGNVLRRLKERKPITIAYLGGSITAAAGWRVKTTEWFRREFPHASIQEVNAAIGGTGSDLGVFRLDRDVLQHRPDLLFVEFAVNDAGTPPEKIWQSMEGIVRKTWAANATADICFVYTFRTGFERELEGGQCPPSISAMEMLAEHYAIPGIDTALQIVELQQAGKLVYQSDKPASGIVSFSQDGVHPLEDGHKIYADVVTTAIKQMADLPPVDHSTSLAHRFVEDNFESARMVPVTASMLAGKWKQLGADSNLARNFTDRMGTLWETSTPGSQITFKAKGSMVRLYDILGPDGGQVTITVDDQPPTKPIPRFDSYCTYHRIATLNVFQGLDPNQIHTVTVELCPEPPDRSLIASRLKDPQVELKSAKYQGTNLRVSHILILGEVVD